MDQKDLAFVFLSLIIVYSAAFTAVIEQTDNHDNTANNPNNPNTPTNATSDNNNESDNNQILSNPPLNIVYNILSNLPAINSQAQPQTTQSPASSPSLSQSTKSPAASINTDNSPQIRIDPSSNTHTNYQMFTINENEDDEITDHEIDNDESSITNTETPTNIDTYENQFDYGYSSVNNPLLLIEPHKPRLNTLSGNQHHIVEYHDLEYTHQYGNINKQKTKSKDIASLSNTILDNANLLITTVDGKFSVLSAEHGSKQMDLDSADEPLYQSPGIAYENQVIPGIDGHLYLLRKNAKNEEYLEPLPFTIEQIAKNTGYADSFNTWYLVDPKNTVFWIDIDKWNVCKPYGNIPDITDESDANDNSIPLCNDALIVTRIDRQITAVDVNKDIPATQWRFKHGEYRVATKHRHNHQHSKIADDRFELWQSLDNDSKYTLFLYDRDRGEIKWSKSLSSIVTNVQLLTCNHQIFNFYVYHTKNAKQFNSNDNVGLWLVPSDKNTQIAIAHSPRNPISNHMFLPHSNAYKSDEDDDDDDDDDDEYMTDTDDFSIMDEDNIENELKGMLNNNKAINRNEIRFVHLSFDGDLDTETNIPSPAIEFEEAGNRMPSWQKGLQFANNNVQQYGKASALRIFNPHELPLPIENNPTHEPPDNAIEHYYYPKNLLTLSFFIAALFLYLTPLRFGIKRLLFPGTSQPHENLANRPILPRIPPNNCIQETREETREEKKIDPNIKIVGKFRYNVQMKLGEGRRGHVFVGTFENRQVAIKRIDRDGDMGVDNEIDILLKVDHQSNIVRYYAKESDNEFDYIALDLCLCSLYDIIKTKNNCKYSGRKIPKIDGISKAIIGHEININSLSIHGKHGAFCSCEQCRINDKKTVSKYRPNNYKVMKNIGSKHLTSHDWRKRDNNNNNNKNAFPPGFGVKYLKRLKRHKFVSRNVKKMCLEMMEGLMALHTAKDGCIIHRDIKPQNILIAIDENNKSNYKCKLADMGMAKLMDAAKISFDSENCGTLFWNAPELIYHKSMSKLPFVNNKYMNSKQLININQIEIGNDLKSIFGPPKSNAKYGLKSIENKTENKTENNEQYTDSEESMSYETENENEESISYSSTEETESERQDRIEWISSSLTKKVDIFSLGCVFSFLLSGGHHPYGDRLIDQHENMERRKPNLKYIQYNVPEAYDLISWMININPKQRPEATQCKNHPFFWSDERILSFLNDTSDYIEKCNKSHELRVTFSLASFQIIGNDWGLFIDSQLLNDAGKHRKYNFQSMRDYLRLMRNKWNHFSELHLKLREKLCEKDNTNIKSATKFLQYFTQYTPQLVMYCYKLIGSAIKTTNEAQIRTFKKYYNQISDNRIQLFNKQVRLTKFRPWYNKH